MIGKTRALECADESREAAILTSNGLCYRDRKVSASYVINHNIPTDGFSVMSEEEIAEYERYLFADTYSSDAEKAICELTEAYLAGIFIGDKTDAEYEAMLGDRVEVKSFDAILAEDKEAIYAMVNKMAKAKSEAELDEVRDEYVSLGNVASRMAGHYRKNFAVA